jgi:hypothetical protein
MQLGFFTMPIHPLGKDWRQCLREDQEAFALADELGFTEAYVGEHVTDTAENITSSVVFIASLASRIKTMRLGTGNVNLPNTHPAHVAAQLAMLDHLLDGRLNFGISPGGLLSDAEIFGNLDNDRNAMFLEATPPRGAGTGSALGPVRSAPRRDRRVPDAGRQRLRRCRRGGPGPARRGQHDVTPDRLRPECAVIPSGRGTPAQPRVSRTHAGRPRRASRRASSA